MEKKTKNIYEAHNILHAKANEQRAEDKAFKLRNQEAESMRMKEGKKVANLRKIHCMNCGNEIYLDLNTNDTYEKSNRGSNIHNCELKQIKEVKLI